MSQMFLFWQDSFTFITPTAFVPNGEIICGFITHICLFFKHSKPRKASHTSLISFVVSCCRFHSVPRHSRPSLTGPQGPMSSLTDQLLLKQQKLPSAIIKHLNRKASFKLLANSGPADQLQKEM